MANGNLQFKDVLVEVMRGNGEMTLRRIISDASKLTGRQITDGFKAQVRNTLQRNCREMPWYSGTDLFHHSGNGQWRLK